MPSHSRKILPVSTIDTFSKEHSGVRVLFETDQKGKYVHLHSGFTSCQAMLPMRRRLVQNATHPPLYLHPTDMGM